MTDNSTPGEAASLPVIGYAIRASDRFCWVDNRTGRPFASTWREVAYESDAQAIIDRLTHELEVARGVGKNLFGCAQELLQENVAKLHDGRLPTDLRDLRTANPSVAECIANLDMWNGRLEAAIDRQALEKLGQHANDEPAAGDRDPMEQFP